jgi:hypothetical protein
MANQVLELSRKRRLAVERRPGGEILRVEGPDGAVLLEVELGPAGPVLRLGTPGLTLRTDGDLAIEAERLSLRGRSGVEIESGAGAALRADGDLETSGRVQKIRARLGNVEVRANDDVKLNGERILLNT